MVTDLQIRRLLQLDAQGLPKSLAALKAGLDPKTARKYRQLARLPSEVQTIMERSWRTRPDAFAEFWPEMAQRLEVNPGLQLCRTQGTLSGAGPSAERLAGHDALRVANDLLDNL